MLGHSWLQSGWSARLEITIGVQQWLTGIRSQHRIPIRVE
jgi:hypothetical protein